MASARFLIGDVFDGLLKLPDDSVDLVLSSPPFLALRSYLPADHPDKAKEIGSEATPADFLDTLLDVVEACDRVLAPHGSLVFELGDTFSGSATSAMVANDRPQDGGYASADRVKYDGRRAGIRNMNDKRQGGGPGWPLDKSLTGIPTLFAWSLAYGRNLLRPERTTEPWRIRNIVVWARPNPPVGALGDKFRPATSYLTVACKARNRWFDLDAVRGPGSPNTHARTAKGVESRPSTGKTADDERRGGNFSTLNTLHNPHGAPPLDYWEIPTAPYRGSHYATWPPDLLIKPILSMCPERVCRVCGEPSRRIVEAVAMVGDQPVAGSVNVSGRGGSAALGFDHNKVWTDRSNVTWTDCGCRLPTLTDTNTLAGKPVTYTHHWRPGVVLDPFCGSGTTLMVATGHGRDAIGIDLDERNAELARERCGMFLCSEVVGDSEKSKIAGLGG